MVPGPRYAPDGLARTVRQLATLALLGVSTGGPLVAQATVDSTPPRRIPPRLLVIGFRSPDPQLGYRLAHQVRDRLERLLPAREWWVVPQSDITSMLGHIYVDREVAWTETDVRMLAQQLRADVVLSVAAADTAGAVRVEATVLRPQYVAAARHLATVEAASPVAAAELLARRVTAASDELRE